MSQIAKCEPRGELGRAFVAQAHIALADPFSTIAAFCDHMVEHGAEVDVLECKRIVRFAHAHASLSFEAGGIRVEAAAATLEELYFARLTVASHVIEFAGGEPPAIAWSGDGSEYRRPPNFQILEVRTIHDVTPRMRRITFAGEDVGRFAQMSALHLNIMIQHPALTEPQWPCVGANGLICWQDAAHKPLLRKYTVRSLDHQAGTLDIDFVLHADAGPGSAFAETARVGDRLGIFGPGGGGLVDANWYLLAGDETALPAISRMLEHLPETARGVAVIEVANSSEVQQLATRSAVSVEWLCRDDSVPGAMLTQAVRQVALPAKSERVFVWAGCEFQAFRDIRAYLRKERDLAKHEHLVVSYWRRGESEDHRATSQ